MNSFEWKELQNLTAAIDTNQERLNEARSRRDVGRLQRLEEEIARAEKRRADLLAHITTHLVNTPTAAAAPRPVAKAAAIDPKPKTPPPSAPPVESEVTAEPIAEEVPVEATAEMATVDAVSSEAAVVNCDSVEDVLLDEPVAEAAQATDADPAASGASAEVSVSDETRTAPMPKGGNAAWQLLTFADIGRAKSALGLRRAEILARQAAELKALDADRNQIAALEQALEVFTRKFKQPSPEAAPLRLVTPAEARQHKREGKAA